MQGWFKLYREIFDTDLWNDVTTFRLFIYLIGMASHRDGVKTKGMELRQGQYIRSYRKLADDLSYKEGRGFKKYSLSTIKNCVNKLIDDERISVEEVDAGTLFTIKNYAKYQDLSAETPNAVSDSSPESPNVNRTEHRTGENEEKDDSINGLSDKENEPPNALNHEVRTNAELSPNELRTKSEQEQELKNLRTKELGSSSGNSDPEFLEIINFYQNNLQKGITDSPFNYELIGQWFDEWGNELLLAAMKVAAKAESKGVNMIEGILRNWREAGVRTLEDARKYEVEFKSNKSSSRANVVKIPNYEKGEENAGSDGEDSNESGDVRLFR